MARDQLMSPATQAVAITHLIAVVFFIFFFCLVSPVRAQDTPIYNCNTQSPNGLCPDEGAAYAVTYEFVSQKFALLSAAAQQTNQKCFHTLLPGTQPTGAVIGWYTNKAYACEYPPRFASANYQMRFPADGLCFAKPPITLPSSSPNKSTFCQDNCEYVRISSSLAIPTARHCVPQDYTCPEGYTKTEDGICKPSPFCPPDKDRVGDTCIPKPPCDGGKLRGTTGVCGDGDGDGKPDTGDGSGNGEGDACPTGQIKAPDGTCIPDTNKPCPRGQSRNSSGTCVAGGGDDGNDDDHEASGGESCSTPPTCSGDAILCAQLRTQWRIDCNTRRTRTVSGGACGAAPICTGEKCDDIEHAMLIMSWRTACAVEFLAGRDEGGSNTDTGAQPAWTRVDDMPTVGDQGASETDTDIIREVDFSVGVIDQSGFLGGHASCPSMASGGSQFSGAFMGALANPPPFWCNFISMVYWVFVSLALIWAVIELTDK